MMPERGDILLSLARAEISARLGKTHAGVHEVDESASWLAAHGACFVTLTERGDLRGCIGTLEAHRPLLYDVKANAVSAAFRDPRFPPLLYDELPHIALEVSLLAPPEPMAFLHEADALAQLRPHEDGLIFSFGPYRSTFLPQVWEQLPDPRRFMAQLKRKAGLPADFWSPEVLLSRYRVEKWAE